MKPFYLLLSDSINHAF